MRVWRLGSTGAFPAAPVHKNLSATSHKDLQCWQDVYVVRSTLRSRLVLCSFLRIGQWSTFTQYLFTFVRSPSGIPELRCLPKIGHKVIANSLQRVSCLCRTKLAENLRLD